MSCLPLSGSNNENQFTFRVPITLCAQYNVNTYILETNLLWQLKVIVYNRIGEFSKEKWTIRMKIKVKLKLGNTKDTLGPPYIALNTLLEDG